MPVSDDFIAFIEDQLGGLPTLRHRRMFGGVGLYSEDLFFGLLADDTLYLKVSERTRPDFERAGMGAFDPYGDPDRVMRGYYQVPPQIVENRDALRVWAERAVEAARTAGQRRPGRTAGPGKGGSRGRRS
jgi:DNA transformation protein